MESTALIPRISQRSTKEVEPQQFINEKSECNPDTTSIATGTRLYKSTADDDNLMDDPKNWADGEDRKSISAYIAKLADGTVSWRAKNPNIIYTDNQGAIALAHNPEHHARTKHVDIQYHFVRNCVEDGTTRLEYCPTEDMVADGLTKALGPERHRKLARMMGMGVWQKSEDYAITKVGEKEGEAATNEKITRMRSGSDGRTSSPDIL